MRLIAARQRAVFAFVEKWIIVGQKSLITPRGILTLLVYRVCQEYGATRVYHVTNENNGTCDYISSSLLLYTQYPHVAAYLLGHPVLCPYRPRLPSMSLVSSRIFTKNAPWYAQLLTFAIENRQKMLENWLVMYMYIRKQKQKKYVLWYENIPAAVVHMVLTIGVEQ